LGQRQCDRRRETARLWIYEAQHGDATPAVYGSMLIAAEIAGARKPPAEAKTT
jgi:hypothetical protein